MNGEPDLPPRRRRRGLSGPVLNPLDPRFKSGAATSMTTIPGVGFQAPQPGTPRSAYQPGAMGPARPPTGEPSLPPRVVPTPQAVPIRTTYGSGVVQNPIAPGYKGPYAPGAAASAASAGGYKDPRATILKIPSQAELLATYNQLRARSPYMAAIWLKNLPHLYQEAVKQYFQNPAHGATGVRLRGLGDSYQNQTPIGEPAPPPPVNWQLFQAPAPGVGTAASTGATYMPPPPKPVYQGPTAVALNLVARSPSTYVPAAPTTTWAQMAAEKQRIATIASHRAKYNAAKAAWLRAIASDRPTEIANYRAIMDVHKRGLEMLGVVVTEDLVRVPAGAIYASEPSLPPQRDPIVYVSQSAPSVMPTGGSSVIPVFSPSTPSVSPLTRTAPYADPNFNAEMKTLEAQRLREQIQAMKTTLTPTPRPSGPAREVSLLPLLAPLSQSYTGIPVSSSEVQSVVDVKNKWGAPIATMFAATGFGAKAVDQAVQRGVPAASRAASAVLDADVSGWMNNIVDTVKAPFIGVEDSIRNLAREAEGKGREQINALGETMLTKLLGGPSGRSQIESAMQLRSGGGEPRSAAERRAQDLLIGVPESVFMRGIGMAMPNTSGSNPLGEVIARLFPERVKSVKDEILSRAKANWVPLLLRYQGEAKNTSAPRVEREASAKKFVETLARVKQEAVDLGMSAALKDPAQARAEAAGREAQRLASLRAQEAQLRRDMSRGSDVAQEAQYARLQSDIRAQEKKVRAL